MFFVSHFVYVHIWDQIGKTKMEKHALRIDHMIRWNTGKQKSSLATGDRHCPAVSSSHFLSWSDKLLKTNSVCWKTHNLNWQWQICISWDDVNCRGDEHLADTTNGQFSQHGRGWNNIWGRGIVTSEFVKWLEFCTYYLKSSILQTLVRQYVDPILGVWPICVLLCCLALKGFLPGWHRPFISHLDLVTVLKGSPI